MEPLARGLCGSGHGQSGREGTQLSETWRWQPRQPHCPLCLEFAGDGDESFVMMVAKASAKASSHSPDRPVWLSQLRGLGPSSSRSCTLPKPPCSQHLCLYSNSSILQRERS